MKKLFCVWFWFAAAAVADDPRISPADILNAAGLFGGKVAPGEVIVLFPANAGPSVLAGQQFDPDGRVSTQIGGMRVLFDGIPSPIAYAVAGHACAVVPYEVSGKKSTQVVVEYRGERSEPVTLAVVESAPALFTLDGTGKGQAAMLNETGCCNSIRNPAAPGEAAVLYATGAGQTLPASVTGAVEAHNRDRDYPAPRAAVRVLVGGQPAEITFLGSAPHMVSGMVQINIRLPKNATVGDAVPLKIIVGDGVSPDGVTMAVRPFARQILVVDAETASRAWLRKMLIDAGYDVFTARNGREAVAVAKDHLLDMAVVSMAISEEERAQTVQSLQAAYPLIKIVATTPIANAKTLRAADLMGAQSLLERPFTASMVLPRLRELLRLHPMPYVATP
ncbi:MAG: response regulator [Bryobacteraceae bacterium]|jgi:uncharacterized protein (TIGR03437 family)